MHFKSPSVGAQYMALHPELRRALSELDLQVRDWGLEEICLTQAIRTPGEQEEIYWPRYIGPSVTEEEARAKARRKLSWHLFGTAADIRSKTYTAQERKKIAAWLKERCPRPEWEFIEHNIGHGDHFHLGRRDWLWARDWERRTREPKVGV